MTSPRLLGTERIGPHHQLNRIRRCALPTLPPEAIPGGATLAPWFRCGWLVQRSLGLFGPARRVITAGCARPVTGLVGWRLPDLASAGNFGSNTQPRYKPDGGKDESESQDSNFNHLILGV